LNLEDCEAQEDLKQANDRLIGMCEETKQKGMPPFSYRPVKGRLSLSPSEVALLCSWSQAFRKDPVGSAGTPERADFKRTSERGLPVRENIFPSYADSRSLWLMNLARAPAWNSVQIIEK
jgi:hypothetical protein